MDYYDSGQGLMIGPCEHRKGRSSPANGEEFLD